MSTVESSHRASFAVWLTGRPASGKSSVAAALRLELEGRGLRPTILESDLLRRDFAPHLSYSAKDRDIFYHQIGYLGALLTDCGVPVIFDATASRRSYREFARCRIPKFLEVYIDSPLDICMARDPKGIYRRATQGHTQTVPGLQDPYEPPEIPDLVVHGDREPPQTAAGRIARVLEERGYIPPRSE